MNDFLPMLWTQTWQIAVLAVTVALCARTFARNRPHLAHALWLLVLIKCVTPPMWGHSLGVFSRLQALTAWDETTSQSALADVGSLSDESAFLPSFSEAHESESHLETDFAVHQSTQPVARHKDSATKIVAAIPAPEVPKLESVGAVHPDLSLWPGLLLSCLAIGASATLSLMIIRCIRCLQSIHQHRTTEFDESLNERLQMLSKKLRLRRVPRLIVSDVLFGPVVLGVLRHTIVLPRCLIKAESGKPKAADSVDAPTPLSAVGSPLSSLDPILAHELLHIRRGDLRTGLLQAIVQSLWWFHPAVWLCNRWLSREAERCCDEQVIAELGCSPAQYARSLLSVIESKHALQPIPVFPGMKPVEITSQRMERIMLLKTGLKKQTPRWCWLVVAAMAIVVLPGAVAKTTRHDEPPVVVPSIDEPRSDESHGDSKVSGKHKGQVRLRAFKGNTFSSDRDLREHLLSKRNVWNLIGEAFAPDTIQADTAALTDYYRSAGFFDVEVTAEPLFSLDRSSVCLVYTLTEGCRYRLREILCEGNKRIASSDLLGEIALKPGDHYSVAKVAEGVRRMRDCYIRADDNLPAINPVPRFNEELGILDLVFRIDESNAPLTSNPAFETSETTNLERVTNPATECVPLLPQAGDAFSDGPIQLKKSSRDLPDASARTSGDDRLIMLTYNVADLVTTFGTTDADMDFSPLIELIKTSIEPESWQPGLGTISPHVETISLVIRQTENAHDGIQKILSQLRKSYDSVKISCRLMQLSADSQLKGLEQRCSLHALNGGQRWALLTKSRSEELQKFLTDEKAELLSCPTVLTISGQSVSIEVGTDTESAFKGFRLSANPHLIADSNVIRLNHSVQIGETKSESKVASHESLVGSGQTLVLLIEQPGKADAASDRYVVLLTPEHLKEEKVEATQPSVKQP